ncbi:hypothetical protein KCU73_g2961, partial [Aureobasidium melanogenum]
LRKRRQPTLPDGECRKAVAAVEKRARIYSIATGKIPIEDDPTAIFPDHLELLKNFLALVEDSGHLPVLQDVWMTFPRDNVIKRYMKLTSSGGSKYKKPELEDMSHQ